MFVSHGRILGNGPGDCRHGVRTRYDREKARGDRGRRGRRGMWERVGREKDKEGERKKEKERESVYMWKSK